MQKTIYVKDAALWEQLNRLAKSEGVSVSSIITTAIETYLTHSSKNEPGVYISDPANCPHHWQPISMVFESQLLDSEGRVIIRQPDIEAGRVYLVCLDCSQHTYTETNWVGYKLYGSTSRGFYYKPMSSHAYSIDGQHWEVDRPQINDDTDTA